jgi:hypothetical protein
MNGIEFNGERKEDLKILSREIELEKLEETSN